MPRLVSFLSLALIACGASQRADPLPSDPAAPQLSFHVDPARFRAGATLQIELVIDSGYGCGKYERSTWDVAPCPAPPPDIHESFSEAVRADLAIRSAALAAGQTFTLFVTGPASTGCDLLRGTARGTVAGAVTEVPAFELVVIPQACPA